MNLAISTPTPGPMFSVFQKKKPDQNGDLQVLQLYRDPKAFSLKNLVYSTEEEWQSLVPPLWVIRIFGFGWEDVPNPDVLVSVRSTYSMEVWVRNMVQKWSPKNIPNMRFYSEDVCILASTSTFRRLVLTCWVVCFYSSFFFFRLATKFSHRRPFFWKDRFNAIKGPDGRQPVQPRPLQKSMFHKSLPSVKLT